MNNSLWLLSLPLKHREIKQQTPEVITQDRQIIFSYLKDKLVTAGDVCKLNSIELPEFKVKHHREFILFDCKSFFRLVLWIPW